MAGRRGWIALVLIAPFAMVAVGTQIAFLTGLVGAGQLAWAAHTRSTGDLNRAVSTVQRAAGALEAAWSSPAATVLGLNPVTLGAMDDLRASAQAASVATTMLDPLATMGAMALGFDGQAPLISGTTIDTERLPALEEPTAQLEEALADTDEALGRIPGSGLLGRPIRALADSADGYVHDLAVVLRAASTALPALPDALGAEEPKRYLVCALNDAELFASGGAPLSAVMVEAVDGTISAPLAGQLESKLSPNNPPITWRHSGGPPWYRKGKRYPFVNSDFHPDFRTAGVDMRRAWAALGYPAVDGVITLDVNALASVLDWAGPVDAGGYGRVSAGSIVRTVLVDAYRDFDSPEGVLLRHARNDQLVAALADHLTSPRSLLPAMRGVLAAIPGRHVQMSFTDRKLRRAVATLGATGALSDSSGDLVGAFSQSGPNKLSVFQERTITQDVQLTARGGALVRRTITFRNAVPEGIAGDPTATHGYLALRARMRVAHRIPPTAFRARISMTDSVGLVPPSGTGPFPDERGGAVLWQGHETAPGATTTVVVHYELPAGTFGTGRYEVSADPQALTLPTSLRVRVTPAPGTALADSPGWIRAGEALAWSGTLDRPVHLVIG